ncbi:hypothetical protein [Marinoscillum sp.]|uniref:hypothetical protein n=1 Tax=Marinoscillum sp. TaxID=2024838 RepID=UPI003BAC9F89
MKTLLTFVLFTSLGLCISCDLGLDSDGGPDVDDLPPLTTTGENTFGYVINGDIINITNSLSFTAFNQGGFFYLGGGGIKLYRLGDVATNLNYSLVNFDDGKVEFSVFDDQNQLCFYDSTRTINGNLLFTYFSREKYIASGIFEFSTVNDDCDTIRVTDGRFDVQYTP